MDDDLSTWSFRAFPNMNDCSPLCDHQVIYKLLTNIDGFTFSTEDEIPDGVLHLISKLLPGEGAESNATADDVADCLAHIFETCLLHIPDVSMDNLWLEALRQIGGQDLDSRDEHVSGGHVLRDLVSFYARALGTHDQRYLELEFRRLPLTVETTAQAFQSLGIGWSLARENALHR